MARAGGRFFGPRGRLFCGGARGVLARRLDRIAPRGRVSTSEAVTAPCCRRCVRAVARRTGSSLDVRPAAGSATSDVRSLGRCRLLALARALTSPGRGPPATRDLLTTGGILSLRGRTRTVSRRLCLRRLTGWPRTSRGTWLTFRSARSSAGSGVAGSRGRPRDAVGRTIRIRLAAWSGRADSRDGRSLRRHSASGAAAARRSASSCDDVWSAAVVLFPAALVTAAARGGGRPRRLVLRRGAACLSGAARRSSS